MGKQIPISTSVNLPDGRTITLETGKLASQADGSVVVKIGKYNVVRFSGFEPRDERRTVIFPFIS